jgi:hypothetical protein
MADSNRNPEQQHLGAGRIELFERHYFESSDDESINKKLPIRPAELNIPRPAPAELVQVVFQLTAEAFKVETHMREHGRKTCNVTGFGGKAVCPDSW